MDITVRRKGPGPLAAAFAAFFCLCAACQTALAERLVFTLSTHRLMKLAGRGDVILLTGSVEQDVRTVPRRSGYDIIATISKAGGEISARDAASGTAWVDFADVPAYYCLLSNKPLDQIATSDILTRHKLGLGNLPISLNNVSLATFRASPSKLQAALIDHMKELGKYREQTSAVTFLTPQLFRAEIPFPANSSTGIYNIEVVLLADGNVLAKEAIPIELVPGDFATTIAPFASEHPTLLGAGIFVFVVIALLVAVKLVTGDFLYLVRW